MTDLNTLRTQMNGPVTAAGDAGYDEARKVYNFMIDRRPEAVAQCTSTADVVAVVNFARETGADLAVRGGSHSVPGFGTADDAVVIDLVGMQRVEVDAARRTAPMTSARTPRRSSRPSGTGSTASSPRAPRARRPDATRRPGDSLGNGSPGRSLTERHDALKG